MPFVKDLIQCFGFPPKYYCLYSVSDKLSAIKFTNSSLPQPLWCPQFSLSHGTILSRVTLLGSVVGQESLLDIVTPHSCASLLSSVSILSFRSLIPNGLSYWSVFLVPILQIASSKRLWWERSFKVIMTYPSPSISYPFDIPLVFSTSFVSNLLLATRKTLDLKFLKCNEKRCVP